MEEEILAGSPYVYVAISMLFGAIGAYIVDQKGRTLYKGFLVGFFFGLLGVLALFFLKSKRQKK